MNFGILVNEGPYQHQASDSAYLFAKAALDEGHTIFRVFFYHDGVNNGTRLATPPQDDRHIPNRWSELAKEHNIDLVLCVAAAQRRGMVDPDEMKLIEIKTADKHLFVDASANVDYNLDIRLYELRSLTLSSDSDGIKVGEVVCVASSSWGGEVDILVVVRPIGHTGLNQDRYAESLTVEWISAK